MSGCNRNSVDKEELRKTLYIECIKHKQQLKIRLLAGKRNMKQYRPMQNVYYVRFLSIGWA